jgi:hypothetical protein
MRAVLYQLHENPAGIADTVIGRFRNLPPGSPARRDSILLIQAHAGNTNLLDWRRRSGSAAMIFEAVAGVARETPAAFGLARERPAP